MGKTLLVALAHPDDEIGCAGTIAAHSALGHRVVLLFLTRGEMTEAFDRGVCRFHGTHRTVYGETDLDTFARAAVGGR